MEVKIIKAIASFLVCCMLLFCFAAPAQAVDPVTVTVVGGTAFVLTITLLSELGIIAGDGIGLTDALKSAADSVGVSPDVYMESLIRQWTTSNPTAPSLGSVLDTIQAGFFFAQNGQLFLTQAAGGMLKDFFDWAWSSEGGALVDFAQATGDLTVDPSSLSDTSVLHYPSIFTAGGVLNLGDLSINRYYVSVSVNIFEVFRSSSNCRFLNILNNNNYFATYCISDSPFTVVSETYHNGTLSNSSTSSSQAITYRGLTFYFVSFQNNKYVFPDYIVPALSFDGRAVSFPNLSDASWDLGYIIYNGQLAGDTALDTSSLVVPSGSLAVLNPDLSYDYNRPGTVPVEDYLKGLADGVLDGTASIPVTDEQDQTEDVPLVLDTPITITDTLTQDAPVEDLVFDQTATDSLSDFTIDLTDFFPFCIPFDVVDMLKLLKSEREAPHFDWTFTFAGTGIDPIELEIDLAPWENVATILRSMELLAFAFGLALGTKKLIQGGD